MRFAIFFILGILIAPCLAAQATRPDKPKSDTIVSKDYNLDGYLDFSIPKSSGAHGDVAEYWLWNPSTRLFERNDYLSNDMNVEVDKDQRAIWTYSSNGKHDSTSKEYLLDHGKIIWVLVIEQRRASASEWFPVTERIKIPVQGRMTTVLKRVYMDEDQFKNPCNRCQTIDDLLGCSILGYGKVVGQEGVGAEVVAFEVPQQKSICAFFPGGNKPNMRLLPSQSVTLNGE